MKTQRTANAQAKGRGLKSLGLWVFLIGYSFLWGTGISLTQQTIAPLEPLQPWTTDGFAVPQPGREFDFPRDHGSHPEFKIEWWYLTGHLFDAEERRFGFQATFFRQAGPGDSKNGAPNWTWTERFRHSPLYLAHMAVLDVASGTFVHQERLNRDGWNAGASVKTLDLFNGNWSLRWTEAPTEKVEFHSFPDRSSHGFLQLRGGVRAEAGFDLKLHPVKPMVRFGDNGISRKAADPTAASYYLTFSRLAAEGKLVWRGQSFTVRGLAWMDHEISSSQLAPDQAGWDWTSIQLNDGRDVMLYRMRRLDGTTDPFSRIAWVDVDGTLHQAGAEAFEWQPITFWTSPITRGRYPVRSRLTLTDPRSDGPVIWQLEPLALDQEMTGALGGVAYWEGACRVLDAGGREIGQAYVELAGYVGRLADRFMSTGP